MKKRGKMKGSLMILFAIFISSIAYGIVINVPQNQPSIQGAIDVASNGDTVLVADGTYYENINFSNHNIVVGSLFLVTGDSWYKQNTIINGSANGSVVEITMGEDSVSLIGFTITNGNADEGGGIICKNNSTPLLQDLAIIENSADKGGGIFCENSHPQIENVEIHANRSFTSGAGIYLKNSEAQLNTVWITRGWSARDGGGVYMVEADPDLQNVEIYENNARRFGGGVLLASSTPTTGNGVKIFDNSARYGGGIYCYDSKPRLYNVEITFNSASYSGGGILFSHSTTRIVDALIAKNIAYQGAGIYSYNTTAILYNTTVTENSVSTNFTPGGGIYCDQANIVLNNCILWNDSPTEFHINSGSITANYSDIDGGGLAGTGNINEDPLFATPLTEDYHLTWANFPNPDNTKSPCIDTGNPYPTFNDPDGTRNDMGAYYFDQSQFMAPPPEGENESERTSTEDEQTITQMFHNFPNPFNPETTISYSLDKGSDVKIEVFNSKGERVKTLVDKYRNEGKHSVLWNGKDEDQNEVSSGVYFYKIKAGRYTSTKKMILMK